MNVSSHLTLGTFSRTAATKYLLRIKNRLHNGESAACYTHNQDRHAIENVRRWYDYWRERPGTGARVNGGGVNIIFSDSNMHHRGESHYRTSGEVDAMRIPKDGFFAHQ